MSHSARRRCPTPAKQHFPSAEAAAAWLRRQRQQGRRTEDQVYRCCCHEWHVGRLTVALRRRIHRALARSA